MAKYKKSILIESDEKMLREIGDNLLLYEHEWKKFKVHYPENAKKIKRENFINMCIAKYYLKENF